MMTRTEKYNEDYMSEAPRRSIKNLELYDEIKNTDIDNFNIGSNAKVIGDNQEQINIDQIKEMLEKNYQREEKKRLLEVENNTDEEELELEKTREYDINAILEKAKSEKEFDYQSERLKKVRDTQYDILKNLELDAHNEINEKDNEKQKQELLDLINTITINEKQQDLVCQESTPLNPLDILSDLKGDDNTVIAGANDLTKEVTQKLSPLKESKKKEDAMDKSFYTNSMSFKKRDFASLGDDEKESSGIIIKILIILVFLAIVAGVVLFLNDFLKLNWF